MDTFTYYEIIGDYKIGKQIGKGSFGQVYLSQKEEINYAFKKIKNEKRFQECALNEIKFLKKINHQNIVKIEDNLEIDGRIYIIFEILQDNLFNKFFKQNNILSFDNLIKYMNEMVEGLDYLHKNKIIHSDLKLENVMLTNDNIIKIIDLGSSLELEHTYKNFYIQSRFYRAPEILYKLDYNEKIDIWSFGVIITELILKHCIFRGIDSKEVTYKIADYINIPKTSDYQLSKTFKNLFFKPQLQSSKTYNDTKDLYTSRYDFYKHKGFRNTRLKNYIKIALDVNFNNVNEKNKLIIIDLLNKIFIYDYIGRIGSEDCKIIIKTIEI